MDRPLAKPSLEPAPGQLHGPMTATSPRNPAPQRVCPTCGELLVAARCPECSPAEPARAYNDRVTQPISSAPGVAVAFSGRSVDARRSTSEWVATPDERDPQTRRAHPMLVRAALAEAEERARDKVARAALVTPVESIVRSRQGQTSPRLRPVTPLPPAPQVPLVEATNPVLGATSPSSSQDAPIPAPEETLASASSPEVTSLDRSRVASQPLASVPPRTPEELVPTPEPMRPVPAQRIDDQRRRVRLFWLALAVGAVAILVAAAL